MPYTQEHKERTRRRIVTTASRQFRAQGFDGVGIAKLMSALELTHGGFYAHFADKEALIAESSVCALDETMDAMLATLNSEGFAAVLDFYLSEAHRDHPEVGCLLPTLAAEMARHSLPTREAFTSKLYQVFLAIAEQMPGKTEAEKLEKVIALFSAMVGAMTLARAVSDPALSGNILRTTRDRLLAMIAS